MESKVTFKSYITFEGRYFRKYRPILTTLISVDNPNHSTTSGYDHPKKC